MSEADAEAPPKEREGGDAPVMAGLEPSTASAGLATHGLLPPGPGRGGSLEEIETGSDMSD